MAKVLFVLIPGQYQCLMSKAYLSLAELHPCPADAPH